MWSYFILNIFLSVDVMLYMALLDTLPHPIVTQNLKHILRDFTTMTVLNYARVNNSAFYCGKIPAITHCWHENQHTSKRNMRE